jgi:hypothetical protein
VLTTGSNTLQNGMKDIIDAHRSRLPAPPKLCAAEVSTGVVVGELRSALVDVGDGVELAEVEEYLRVAIESEVAETL